MDERRWRRVRSIAAMLCLVTGLWLVGDWWLDHVTAASRPRGLWRAVLPGVDLGVDAWPASPGRGGYVQLWAYPHDANDIWRLLRLPGAPALPRLWQSGRSRANQADQGHTDCLSLDITTPAGSPPASLIRSPARGCQGVTFKTVRTIVSPA
jgi:hypothetical protein